MANDILKARLNHPDYSFWLKSLKLGEENYLELSWSIKRGIMGKMYRIKFQCCKMYHLIYQNLTQIIKTSFIPIYICIMCVCVSCIHAAEADNNSVIKLAFMCLGFFPLYLVLCIMDFVHSYKLKWKQLIGKDQAWILVRQYGLSTSHVVITM